MAENAWNSDSYALFLLWISQYFYFTTPTMIKQTTTLSRGLSCISKYYLAVKDSLVVDNLVIQVLTEEIFQLTGVLSSEFMPFVSIPVSVPPSFLAPHCLLFLLQSFSEAFGDLLATSASTASILDNSRGNVFTSTARKIRPRDVNLVGEVSHSGDPLFFVTDDRSQNLLASYASQHSQEYELLRTMVVFLLQQEGKTVTTVEFVNSIMKKEYREYKAFVSTIYEDEELLGDNIKSQSIESKSQLLQTHVESIVLKSICECVSKKVCEEASTSLLTLSCFRRQ